MHYLSPRRWKGQGFAARKKIAAQAPEIRESVGSYVDVDRDTDDLEGMQAWKAASPEYRARQRDRIGNQ